MADRERIQQRTALLQTLAATPAAVLMSDHTCMIWYVHVCTTIIAAMLVIGHRTYVKIIAFSFLL